MSDEDESRRPEATSDADRTLLGVAPPRIDSSETLQRSPVFVRSGTSVSEIELQPSRTSPSNLPAPAAKEPKRPRSDPANPSNAFVFFQRERCWRLAQQRPVLWMIVAPVLFAIGAIGAIAMRHQGHRMRSASRQLSSAQENNALVASEPEAMAKKRTSVAALEGKPSASLSASELLQLADAFSEQRLADARALGRKLEDNPALAKESAVQAELLRFADDDLTARDALAAMASLAAPVGADLLYEAWTRSAEHSDTTQLARALLYSVDVHPKASPALAVALGLRAAETCEQYRAALPNALKDGDHRSLPLLLKLNSKRGCGPKKGEDCFACLREPKGELAATIRAVKSRRAPSYAAR